MRPRMSGSVKNIPVMAMAEAFDLPGSGRKIAPKIAAVNKYNIQKFRMSLAYTWMQRSVKYLNFGVALFGWFFFGFIGYEGSKNRCFKIGINGKPPRREVEQVAINKNVRHGGLWNFRFTSQILDGFSHRIITGNSKSEKILGRTSADSDGFGIFFWAQLHGSNNQRFCVGAS